MFAVVFRGACGAHRLLAVAAASALVAAPGTLRADESRERTATARAEVLFAEGVRLFNLGRYPEACSTLEASLAHYAGVGTRGKLAECYEKLGRTASAWRLYRDVERLARQDGDSLRQGVAAERIRALEPHLARLVIEPGPSAARPGFSIRANAQLMEPRTFGSPLIVDPGRYVVVAAAAGHRSHTMTVHVEAGSVVTARMPALVPARWTGPRIAALGLAGAGVLGLAGTGYFGLRARSQWSRVEAACGPELVCGPAEQELALRARTNANRANLLAAGGVLSVAAGAILWWRAGRERELRVTAGPAGIGITMAGRF